MSDLRLPLGKMAGLAPGVVPPELQLKAVAAAAPAADLAQLLADHRNDDSGVTIDSYAMAAVVAVYGPGDPSVRLDTALTPAGVAVVPQIAPRCLLTDVDELVLPAATKGFVGQLCTSGEHVTFRTYPGIDHGLIGERTVLFLLGWFADVRASRTTDDACTTATASS